MQAVYAFHQEGPESISAGEKQLMVSLEKLYELYVHLLSLLVEMSDFSRRRIEENRVKQLPTYEDLHPSLKFVDNRFMKQLANNRDYLKHYSSYKINWVDEEDMLRKLHNLMGDDESFQTYLNSTKASYNEDKRVVGKTLLNIFATSEHVRGYFEERSIYWTEDFDLALMMVDKTIKGYKESSDEYTKLPSLLKDENSSEGSDYMLFTKELYRKTIINDAELSSTIDKLSSNWDIGRIALIDVILLKMAFTELLEFPSIPVKVTMNEYIELSKEYSSKKSKDFINGILDKAISEFNSKDLIKKAGRGLME